MINVLFGSRRLFSIYFHLFSFLFLYFLVILCRNDYKVYFFYFFIFFFFYFSIYLLFVWILVFGYVQDPSWRLYLIAGINDRIEGEKLKALTARRWNRGT